jgi:DNA-directed RNA polymerase, mitochondrial
MSTDFDRSVERVARSEEQRARTTGFGTTKQGQALVRKYRGQLADRIGEERAYGRNKAAWRALRGTNDDDLGVRLLVAGISVCADDGLGVDRDGEKNLRDQALWIGRNFGQRGETALRVGEFGFNMLLKLPIFTLGPADVLVLLLTDSLDAFLDDVLVRSIKKNPLLSPLSVSPEPWTQVRRGGLPADHWAQVSLIRDHHRSIEHAARKAISDGRMQPVLDAINLLQSVPFAINVPVLDFMLRMAAPPPPGPKPPVWHRKKFEQWAKARIVLTSFNTTMVTAEWLTELDRFFVPLTIDFRGRFYAIPHFCFAREDRVRALFVFADGEPIGEGGLQWLKAHVAACADGTSWSHVKKPSEQNLAGRVAWTEENLDLLRKIGEAVLRGDDPANLKWALPKKPFQFVAACVELAQALGGGPDFKTRLPLTFDASCSGLQHMCAMTRAEEGRYVNLTGNEGDDFYRRVAFRVWQTAPDLPLEGPFDREIVKQPAMSYFYGSRPGGYAGDKRGRWRPHGMTKQVAEVLKERGQSTRHAKELAHTINKTIAGMVPRASQIREDFLEALAKLVATKGKSLRWTTPLGLPVINCYYEADEKDVSITLNGRRRRVTLIVGDTDDIDGQKAANSVTANFVHSADAVHLQMVALAAAKEGINIVSIHDCFGTIAPRAERLNAILREQFVQMHKRNNLLAAVLDAARRDLPRTVKLPQLPEIGNAEIEDVLKSFHAFK